MRIGTGAQEQVIGIRWHKATRPPLPFPTIYNSHWWLEQRDWLSDDFGYQGELFGARRRITPYTDAPAYPGFPLPYGEPRLWLGNILESDPRHAFSYPMGAYSRDYNFAYDAD
jgi:hypothetical protein